MRIIDSPRANPASLVIVPGAFNPPTRAHVRLAHSALDHADAVLFALPSILPHKEFTGASLEQRARMLTAITSGNERFGTAVAAGGLYIDIAFEARREFPNTAITLLCGRDAAERIVGWSYDEPGTVERMLAEFELLVAPRESRYQPPEHLRSRIKTLETPNLDEYSSTRLRERLMRGENWQELAPEEIVGLIAEIYGSAP